jgi:hypothetical protein
MGRRTELGKIEELLPKEYKWECQGQNEDRRKDREREVWG